MNAYPDGYQPADWPDGLRCADSHREFLVGQPVSQRLFAMDEYAFEPVACVEIVCCACALKPGS
jgi:hypothetical protein